MIVKGYVLLKVIMKYSEKLILGSGKFQSLNGNVEINLKIELRETKKAKKRHFHAWFFF